MQQEVTIDTAGRVVLLKRVRDRLRLQPGDALQLDDDDEQITMRPVRRPAVLRKELGVWSTGAALDHGVGEVPQKDRYHHDRDAAVSQKLFEFRAAALFDGVGKYRRQDSEEADEVEYPTQRRNNRGDAGRNEGERCTDNDLRRDDQREAVKPDERYGARTADQCGHEQQRSLEGHMVDNRAGRGLRDDGCKTGRRCRDADRRRVSVTHAPING